MRRMHSASNSGLGAFFIVLRVRSSRDDCAKLLLKKNYTVAGHQALWPTGRPLFASTFANRKDSLRKKHGLGCTIPSQGVLWPEICKLRAATAGRILPSALPINSFFRNADTRPQSDANLAARQRRLTKGDLATGRLLHREHL